MERSQPEGVKSKMRERKLRMGVNWQGVLQLNGVKEGLGDGWTEHFVVS
jgi:hypothetical protein